MNKTAKIAALYLGERVISVGSSFLVTLLVARKFGAEMYGGFSLAQTVTSYLIAALVTGCEATVVRELVGNPDRRSEVLSAAIRVMVILTWGLATLCALGYLFFSPENLLAPGLLFLLAVLPSPFLAFEMDFKAKRLAQSVLCIRGSTTVVMGGLKIGAAIFGGSINLIVGLFVAEAFVLSALYYFAYHLKNSGIKSRIRDEHFTRLIWREILPASLATATVILFFRVNHFLLASMSGLKSVGQYAIAINFVQLFDVVLGVAVTAIYPKLVEIRRRDPGEFMEALGCLANVFAAAALVFAIAATFFGKQIICYLFGGGYAEAGVVFSIIAWCPIFNSSGLVRSQFINAYAMPLLHVKNAVAGLSAILIVSLPCIYCFGAKGAAIGLIAGCAISGVVMSFVLPETRAIGYIQIQGLIIRPKCIAGLMRLR